MSASRNVAASDYMVVRCCGCAGEGMRGLLIAAWTVALVCFETGRSLRKVQRSKVRRDVRNLLIAAPAGAVMQVLETPIAFRLAQWAERKRWGIVTLLHLPSRTAAIGSMLLLDYTLYWWHYLTHRVPALWRFHQVHHLDQEMDATTGLRFHCGEITISVLFRAAQMIVIGPKPAALTSWQLLLFLSVLFHHSNVRLPLSVERKLARFVVTPRLHGIHHSIAPHEVNSNWSSGLSIWDWLHGTLRTETSPEQLVLGVRGLLEPDDDSVVKALMLPFRVGGEHPSSDAKPVRQSPELLS